ncbi:O-methyltransferase [Streptomyces clavuligerus]|nr:class I SAM-dependent methyltransferase [Streptomyces clavuligerus]ANW21665.1 methyltransferase [Streptomyces clavuligerus]AXU16294.1 methyltransferase [Streptomyces clavuligerus]MBY6306453.1 class I SAM-dependent methyltransferase [Streptomyces clavuligerus]QCS09073.1 methyltransferase [Streptomyces clavuligerus]QPJ91592.1 methyltransferase [Streptomyces clavuligerus]
MEYRSDAVFQKPTIFRQGIAAYAEEQSTAPAPELLRIAADTARAVPEWADISSGRLQVAFLQMLIASGRMRRVLEIGTFTGHGTVGMAAALPDDAEIVTVDSYVTEPRARGVAERAFAASAHQHKIKPVFADGLDGLRTAEGDFDLIFLDADKPRYITYFETILERGLLRPHGLLVVDNTLWGGEVLALRDLPPADEAVDGKEWVERMFSRWAHDVVAFNAHVAADPRVRTVLLTVHDGMTLIRRAP